MKIRTRLTLRFTLIVASILLLFSACIYYFSEVNRHQLFYSRLEDKVLNTGKLLIDVQEVDSNLFRIIDRNTTSLPQEQILVYNSQNKQLYNTNDNDSSLVDVALLDKIRNEGVWQYSDEKKESLGILHTFKNEQFVIIASAADVYGFSKLNNLKYVLIIGFIACTLITMLSGWMYAGRALSPISYVISQVDDITANDLSKRVKAGNGKDEIAQLADTFNQMLDRIDKAFQLQKSFVSNASHELRTPLTSITGQIEVALMKERSIAEHEAVLLSLLDDMKSLNKLANGLLALTQADIIQPNANINPVRIDELLWQARKEIIKHNPAYDVHIQIIDFTEDESRLIVLGNEFLLKSAIMNLMENACKFSPDHSVKVNFSVKNNIEMTFIDRGVGIAADELKNVLQPFFRGSNAKNIPGHGLGLSLTHKIIAMHKGSFGIYSVLNEGTIVSISFPGE
ncbi:MAG: ATP-binding protein [Flavobacteriales bacterium]